MDFFCFKEGGLFCEDVSLERIACDVGTPFYCYSEKTLRNHFQVFQKVFAAVPSLVCYSVKANSNLAVLDVLAKEGAGFDIVSGGELERLRRIQCPPKRIVFSGVGKSQQEIRAALEYGILMFNVESRAELYRINTLAADFGTKALVALRVNPDVDPLTHPHISTGLRENKFGLTKTHALQIFQEAAQLAHVEMVGLDCHIGSQLTSLAPFVDALRGILDLVAILRQQGVVLRYLDLGGGLGIPYAEGQVTPHPEHYADALLAELGGLDITLILEPGRVIVGNAGVLVARVEYIKEAEDKHFVITDAGMNDLIRPALYGAHHIIQPVRQKPEREGMVVDVVGPICESGDFFARDRLLPAFQEGELLAIRSAGAYGFVMSSNYNSRPRVAEVMVRGDRFAVVRRRETMDQLMQNEEFFPQ